MKLRINLKNTLRNFAVDLTENFKTLCVYKYGCSYNLIIIIICQISTTDPLILIA